MPISRWKQMTQRTGWPFGPILTLLGLTGVSVLLWAAPYIRDFLEAVP